MNWKTLLKLILSALGLETGQGTKKTNDTTTETGPKSSSDQSSGESRTLGEPESRNETGEEETPIGNPPKIEEPTMLKLKLVRHYSPKHKMGTHGVLQGLSREFFTVENPWQDNEVGKSCIPEGKYICRPRRYNKGGYDAYEITNVPGRTHILFHIANTHEDVLGCIGVGNDLGFVKGAWAVTASGAAFADFMKELDNREFELEITHFKGPVWPAEG